MVSYPGLGLVGLGLCFEEAVKMSFRHFFRGFRKGMELFGQNIAAIVNVSLLLAVYVVGVGLTSLFAKLFGKHFLELKVSKRKKSYWSRLNLKKRPIEEYYRMF